MTVAKPRRTPRQARSATTVGFILEAAARVFGERGYAATTNEIAARAGVSIGSLYQYFANKDALLVALAERHVADARETIIAALAVPATDRDAFVRQVIEAVVAANRPDALHVLLYDTAPRTPGLLAALEQVRGEVAVGAAWLLTQAGVPDEVARRRADTLVVALDAAIHERVLPADTDAEREARIDDVVTLTCATLDAFATGPTARGPD